MASYKFRCALVGHKNDVRAVAYFSSDSVVSASRDFTARTWHLSMEGSDSSPGEVLLGHQNYVSAVAVLDSENETDRRIFTGSNDKQILGYAIGQENPTIVLKGHNDTVCALSVDQYGTLVSASWDKTVKVWKHGICRLTITGHDAAVWCVLSIPGSETKLQVVTGSADCSIKIWQVCLPSGQSNASYSLERCLLGHSDCVRGLARVDAHRFLSASNDASVRAWDMRTGLCVGEFYGHTNFVYAVATRDNLPRFVSSGEDRSVRVWPMPTEDQWGQGKQFSALQSIPLPCQSAWCVALSPLGDIVVGGSDAVVRIFSSDPVRQASEDAIKTYEAELASSQIQAPAASGTGDLDPKKLPGIEALLIPGKREGQVLVVKQDGRTVCYQWSANESRWLEVGDVVGTEHKALPMYEGKEYDFVFTVDISESIPPLKLPYNRTEDPWFAAQAFLQRNDLPADYLDTVANFIIRNAGPQLSAPPSATIQSDFIDPLTGSSRYIPGSDGSQPLLSTKDQCEAPEVSFLSQTFIPLKSISLGPLLGKLEIFIKETTSTADGLLDQARSFSFDMSETDAVLLTTSILSCLRTWPSDKIFPLLDLLRCLVFWPPASQAIFSDEHLSLTVEASLKHRDSSPANVLLVLRLLSNALAADGPLFLAAPDTFTSNSLNATVTLAPVLGDLVRDDRVDLTGRKPHQVAFATLLHNLTVLAHLSSGCASTSTCLPRLISLPGLCVRTALYLLSIGPSHGAKGVTLFHPEAIFALLISVGISLVNLTNADVTASSAEVLKARRIRFLASAAIGLLSGGTENKPGDETELEFAAWERARKVIAYWGESQTVLPKVRASAMSLLRLLE